MQHDVLGLDVAVDHPVPVGIVEGAGDLGREPDGVGDGQLLLAGEPVAQALALHERHDVIRGPMDLARVDQAENMGVLQVGDGLDLAEEPLGPDHGRELGPEHLDGDLAGVPKVLGEVDRGHAPRPELALDAVAVGQSCGEAREGVGHGPQVTCGCGRRVASLGARGGGTWEECCCDRNGARRADLRHAGLAQDHLLIRSSRA